MPEIRSVCVYCGSSSRVPDSHKRAAQELGRLLAERGIGLVYGGGRVGLMGIIADTVLEGGGEVVGIIPHHIQALEIEHTQLTELHVVDSMHTRKRMMFDRSDAFIALPGGLGTLDEVFEMLTWRQLKLHDKPIIFVDHDGYWQPLLQTIEHMIRVGFVRPEHRGLYDVVDHVRDVPAALARTHEPMVEPQMKWL